MMTEKLCRCISILFLILIVSCSNDDKLVTIETLDAFKSSMNSALPIGSSKLQVENYLADLGLKNTYVSDENIFYAIVPDIGRYRAIYQSSLLIRVKLNEQNHLKSIEYEVEHTGL